MKIVGELFGTGQMQLPFVLQSAETMKRSVAHLEPHMDKQEGGGGKGRPVLTLKNKWRSKVTSGAPKNFVLSFEKF